MGQTGKVKISASESEGGEHIKARHYIYVDTGDEDEKGKQITSCDSYEDKACKEKIPVGKYIVESSYNKFKQTTAIEITAGETLKINIVMGQTGKVKITASESKGSELIHAAHYIYIDTGDEDKKGKQITSCDSYKDRACKEKLPVGKYIIKSSYNEFKQTTPLEITAGKTTKINIVMEKPKPSHDELIKADSQENANATSSSAQKLEEKVQPSGTLSTKEESPDSSASDKASENKKTSSTNTHPNKTEENPLGDLGALLGAVNGTVKESKPLQALKASIEVALPYMEKTKDCYAAADTLDDAKDCDVTANEGIKVAHEKMLSISDMTIPTPKAITQKEWNDEIKRKKVKKETKDLEEAKLNIICIDKGARMKQLQECVAAKGEFTNKPTELDKIGDMLKMFGGAQ